MPGDPFFSWAAPYIRPFLGDEVKKVLFIPFAAVTFSFDEYLAIVNDTFGVLKYSVRSVHTEHDLPQAVKDAEAIVIGGGNSFVLLNRLYQNKLVDLIREKVLWGTPYLGWSAGVNAACPSIMTTNDMPVVHPPSLDALNLIPFQINPHYTDFKPPEHGGETRRQRIEEFLELNRHRNVVGLPEGMLLQREENSLTLHGDGIARLFQYGKSMQKINPGDDVNFLLNDLQL